MGQRVIFIFPAELISINTSINVSTTFSPHHRWWWVRPFCNRLKKKSTKGNAIMFFSGTNKNIFAAKKKRFKFNWFRIQLKNGTFHRSDELIPHIENHEQKSLNCRITSLVVQRLHFELLHQDDQQKRFKNTPLTQANCSTFLFLLFNSFFASKKSFTSRLSWILCAHFHSIKNY